MTGKIETQPEMRAITFPASRHHLITTGVRKKCSHASPGMNRWEKKSWLFFFFLNRAGLKAHPYFNRPMRGLIPSSCAQMAVVIIVLQTRFPTKQGKMTLSAWAQIYSKPGTGVLRWRKYHKVGEGGGVSTWQLE